MRRGILALLGFLAVGAGTASAQPAPVDPSPPTPGQPPIMAPAPSRYGPAWDRRWEAIILSAAGPAATAPPPAPPPEPAEPELPANRWWLGADYLMWWTKNGPLPAPLLTTGSANAVIIGGLTQPGTRVLFGGSDLDYGTASGLRLDAGLWLDDDRQWGLAGGALFLEQRSTGIDANSNASGSPVLAQPLIEPATGQEFTEVVALPGLIAGGFAITSHSRLQAWEINGLASAVRTERLSLDVLAGLRMAKLDEDLQSFSAFSPLVNDFLTLAGQPIGTASTLTTLDNFQAQNKFYGLQVGGRLEWDSGPLVISVLGKLALGGTQELVRITGESSLVTPGAATITVPGGVLAVGSNSGRHFRDEFAVLPELGLQAGYRLGRHVEVRFGYSLLYWSNVARPGNQINRMVAPGLVPTDPAFTGIGTQPTFQFRSSEYWAQGLNFGLVLHF